MKNLQIFLIILFFLINFQLITALGMDTGDILVNTETEGAQMEPEIAMDSEGNVVVVWTNWGPSTPSGGIYAQMIDNTGTKIGGEILVSEDTTKSHEGPSVLMDEEGNFLVLWSLTGESWWIADIFGQLFDKNGNKRGEAKKIHPPADFRRLKHSSSINADGDFAVAIQKNATAEKSIITTYYFENPFSEWEIPEFKWSYTISNPLGDCHTPAVAIDSLGNVLTAYLYNESSRKNKTSGKTQVLGNVVAKIGTVEIEKLEISPFDGGDCSALKVSERYKQDPVTGIFRVIWAQLDDGNADVKYTYLDVIAKEIGEIFTANSDTEGEQSNPSCTGMKDGSSAISWTDINFSTYEFSLEYAVFDKNDNRIVDDTQLNTTNSANHNGSKLKAVSKDNVITIGVTWERQDKVSYDDDIYLRIFDESISAITPTVTPTQSPEPTETPTDIDYKEITIPMETYGKHKQPDIVIDLDSNIIVTWVTESDETPEGAIFTQKFDKNLDKIGFEVYLSYDISKSFSEPSAFVDENNNSFFTFLEMGDNGIWKNIAITMIDNDGIKKEHTVVLTNTDEAYSNHSESMNTKGDLAVAVQKDDPEGNPSIDTFVFEVYDDNDIVMVSALPYYGESVEDSRNPSGCINPNAVLTLADNDPSENVYSRMMNSEGELVIDNLRMNLEDGYQCLSPVVAESGGYGLTSDKFSICWADSNKDLNCRSLDVESKTLDNKITVNSNTKGDNPDPDISGSKNGELGITWTEFDETSGFKKVYFKIHDDLGLSYLEKTEVNKASEGDNKNSKIALKQKEEDELVAALCWESGDPFGTIDGIMVGRVLLHVFATPSPTTTPTPSSTPTITATPSNTDPISLALSLKPEKQSFKVGDQLQLLLSVQTYDKPVLMDLYWVVLPPEGELKFAPDWLTVPNPILKGIVIPEGFSLTDVLILNTEIPNMMPYLKSKGNYTYAMGATHHDTLIFIAPITTDSFKFE